MKKHTPKQTVIMIAIALVINGGSFYGGIKYDQAQRAASRGQFPSGQMGQFGGQQNGGQKGMRAGGNFVGGEILSKDDKSITIKLQDGGSKIVFLSASTQIMKSTAGSLEDLAVGTVVTTTGPANPDGSITAQSIQTRPATTTKQ
jgi:hypothetical protein